MVISVDFDETWTKDPEAWRTFARLFRGRGHTIIVTTNRDDIPGFSDLVRRAVGTRAVKEVIFAGAKPKRRAASERGYDVDVWIDDHPEMVVWGRYHPLHTHCECRDWPGPRPPGHHHPLCPTRSRSVVG